jgi:hypothetical protein
MLTNFIEQIPSWEAEVIQLVKKFIGFYGI